MKRKRNIIPVVAVILVVVVLTLPYMPSRYRHSLESFIANLTAPSVSPEVERINKKNALFLTASRNHDFATMTSLLEQGISIDCVDITGETALQHAVNSNSEKVVRYLLMKGANVNMVDSSGNTPLHNAVCQSNDRILELLLKYNADVSAKVKGSLTTPLHTAARYNDIKKARILLDHGADINAQDYYECTPLHYVFSHIPLHKEDPTAMYKLLMHYKPNLLLKDTFGKVLADMVDEHERTGQFDINKSYPNKKVHREHSTR